VSWHYLQGQAEACWEGTSWAGAPSALSRLMPTVARCYSPDKETGCCPDSLSGMTCGHSMDDHGGAMSTSCLEDSHAKILAKQGREPELAANSPASGGKCSGWFAKYCPDTSGWKTSQLSVFGGSEPFSGDWPKVGTMQNGACWERMTLEHPIGVKECGSWPTPTAGDAKSSESRCTPNSKAALGISLTDAGRGDGGRGRRSMLPTPISRDWKSGTGADHGTHSPPLSSVIGGQLNPTWVEWLMNWPLGWTSLEAMNNDDFREWTQKTCAEDEGGQVRTMWWDRDPSSPSQRPKPDEQHPGERQNALPAMSHERSHGRRDLGARTCAASAMCNMRNGISADAAKASSSMREAELCEGGREAGGREALVPRTEIGVKNRVDRLKAIGNGQVPAVVQLAWDLLYNRIK